MNDSCVNNSSNGTKDGINNNSNDTSASVNDLSCEKNPELFLKRQSQLGTCIFAIGRLCKQVTAQMDYSSDGLDFVNEEDTNYNDSTTSNSDSTKSAIIYLPNTQGLLKPASSLIVNDMRWKPEAIIFKEIGSDKFVHKRVAFEIGKRLGAQLLRKVWVDDVVRFEGWEAKGPSEPLPARIKNLLKDYKVESTFREVIQNAADSGESTSEVHVVLDWRTYGNSSILTNDMEKLQGPSLYFYNNGYFSDHDWESILKLGRSGKKDLVGRNKIGCHGVGFYSIFNFTDVPSIWSGGRLLILDPHLKYLHECGAVEGKPGIQFDFDRKDISGDYEDQFAPYRAVSKSMKYDFKNNARFQGTLIRAPLRTQAQFKSEISNHNVLNISNASANRTRKNSDGENEIAYERQWWDSLLADLYQHSHWFLLFLKNIRSFKVSEILQDGTVVEKLSRSRSNINSLLRLNPSSNGDMRAAPLISNKTMISGRSSPADEANLDDIDMVEVAGEWTPINMASNSSSSNQEKHLSQLAGKIFTLQQQKTTCCVCGKTATRNSSTCSFSQENNDDNITTMSYGFDVFEDRWRVYCDHFIPNLANYINEEESIAGSSLWKRWRVCKKQINSGSRNSPSNKRLPIDDEQVKGLSIAKNGISSVISVAHGESVLASDGTTVANENSTSAPPIIEKEDDIKDKDDVGASGKDEDNFIWLIQPVWTYVIERSNNAEVAVLCDSTERGQYFCGLPLGVEEFFTESQAHICGLFSTTQDRRGLLWGSKNYQQIADNSSERNKNAEKDNNSSSNAASADAVAIMKNMQILDDASAALSKLIERVVRCNCGSRQT